jgi:hypothetical protein
MRLLFDVRCLRCDWTSSAEGVDKRTAREIGAAHVCADGVSGVMSEPTARRVPGPGERQKLPEERL